jgi:cellobiose-specific phosphotransferase system component IIC
MPSLQWTRDWVIVWISAQFTIVLIPVVAVCLFAKRFALFIVSVMAWVSLPWVWSYARTFQLHGFVDWTGFAQSLVVVIAASLLYVPSAWRWLKQEKATYDQVFE